MSIAEIFDHIEKIDLSILRFVDELLGPEFDLETLETKLNEAPDWKIKGLPEQMENLEQIALKYYPPDTTKDFRLIKSIVKTYLGKYSFYWENMESIYYWSRDLQKDLVSVRVCNICNAVFYPSQMSEEHKCKGKHRWKNEKTSMSPSQAPKFYPPYYRDVQKFTKMATKAPYNIPIDYRGMELLLQLYEMAKAVRHEISERKQEEANRVILDKWIVENGIMTSGAFMSEPLDLFPHRQVENTDDIRTLLEQEAQLQAERDALNAERPENFRTKAARIWRDEVAKPKNKEFGERDNVLRETRLRLLHKYVLTPYFGQLHDRVPILHPTKESYTGPYIPNFRKGWNTATNNTLDALKVFETKTEDFRKPYLSCYRRGRITVSGGEEIDTKYSTIYRREGIAGLYALMRKNILPSRIPKLVEILKTWYLYPFWRFRRYSENYQAWYFGRDQTGIAEAGLNCHLQVVAKGILDLFLAH